MPRTYPLPTDLLQSKSHTIGEAIRDARRRRGLNQGQLAELAGTTQAQVSLIERGGSQYTVQLLMRVAYALGVDLDQLLGDALKAPPPNR